MKKNIIQQDLHNKLSNALRILSIEMVEEAKSGHPGMPMGFADVATVLFQYFLKFNPNDPIWANRDRFILSAGHGSALLYSLLFLTGYNGYKLSDLKKFRKIGSITPGHPEYDPKLGIETTTGPLGQGLANGIGMAISEKKMKSKLSGVINHKIYIVVGDGCLMEGISHEAMSLAGHLGLNNIVVLFDDNKISIDGPTSLAVSDMTLASISSYNWNVISVDGHSPNAIWKALDSAQKSDKPMFIACRTKIGYGSPNFENSEESHGKCLGMEEINLIKKKLNWTYDNFVIPDPILKIWRNFYKRNLDEYLDWENNCKKSYLEYHQNNDNLNIVMSDIKKFKKDLDTFHNSEATRKSSNKIINIVCAKSDNYIGGSADLSGSNGTKSNNYKIISKDDFTGNYIHYGVREHAMVAIMNGINIHDKFKSFGGTFLVFSDYLRPSIRLASLMKLPIILVFTHDSIGVGEDGPTHQPVEHLSSLRAIPNLNLFRPADAIETAECWELMIKQTSTPSAICLSRQNLPQLRNKININNVKNLVGFGAYILYQSREANSISIFASGSELSIAMDVAKNLEKKQIGCKVISVPCQEIFWEQSLEYQMAILCNNTLKIAIEAGNDQSWSKFIGPHGAFFGVENFGKSGKNSDVYSHFGLTVEKITKKILKIINPAN
ncbi:transketolase [Candidatus Aquarickettsia rohweri]|uniref:Transketolase n=1 Tax=Candidatus Aquarickettsia rohweri TaxID=2602574 RepID=A0A3R9XP82_9RICK|nr:transketolase [Candidatus Aquarickettsia rohweri]RST67214.1 transketolase [Candidatus Aquarickettsia rohweri]